MLRGVITGVKPSTVRLPELPSQDTNTGKSVFVYAHGGIAEVRLPVIRSGGSHCPESQ